MCERVRKSIARREARECASGEDGVQKRVARVEVAVKMIWYSLSSQETVKTASACNWITLELIRGVW